MCGLPGGLGLPRHGGNDFDERKPPAKTCQILNPLYPQCRRGHPPGERAKTGCRGAYRSITCTVRLCPSASATRFSASSASASSL